MPPEITVHRVSEVESEIAHKPNYSVTTVRIHQRNFSVEKEAYVEREVLELVLFHDKKGDLPYSTKVTCHDGQSLPSSPDSSDNGTPVRESDDSQQG